jgi:hypothetical protein
MWFLLIKKARWLKLFAQNNELSYFCSVIKQINKKQDETDFRGNRASDWVCVTAWNVCGSIN